jgi:RNA polymerase sigma-70 factor, ECF subfamily
VAGEPWAAAALLDRYGSMVERLIRRVMGHDPELADLVHDAFATILASVHQVRAGEALKGWIAQVAVHSAHHAIRKRRATRWLCFWRAGMDPPAEPTTEPALGPRDAVRRVYEVLDHLPADERVAFVLRFLEDMTVNEVAEACDVSLATIKRRLTRAERRFVAAAQRDPVLRTWLEEGDRWTAG